MPFLAFFFLGGGGGGGHFVLINEQSFVYYLLSYLNFTAMYYSHFHT